jgi:hypothetical protein
MDSNVSEEIEIRTKTPPAALCAFGYPAHLSHLITIKGDQTVSFLKIRATEDQRLGDEWGHFDVYAIQKKP